MASLELNLDNLNGHNTRGFDMVNLEVELLDSAESRIL